MYIYIYVYIYIHICIQKYVRKIEDDRGIKKHTSLNSCNMSRPPGSETSPYPDSWWDPEVQGDKMWIDVVLREEVGFRVVECCGHQILVDFI